MEKQTERTADSNSNASGKTQLIMAGLIFMSIALAIYRVMLYLWLQPNTGDFAFYVSCCTSIPSGEQPVVPLLLYAMNLLVRDPVTTVSIVMMMGYSITFILMYIVGKAIIGYPKGGLVSYAALMCLLPAYLTPTALKNIYGIIFMLVCIWSLYCISRPRGLYEPDDLTSEVLSIGVFFISAMMIGFTHSVPLFAIAAILFGFGLYRKSGFLLCAIITTLAIAYAIVYDRLYKILAYAGAATSGIVSTVIDKLSFMLVANPLLFIAFLTVYAVGVYKAVKMDSDALQKPMLVGIVIAIGVLLAAGDLDAAERFTQNAMPLFALMAGYILMPSNRISYCKDSDSDLDENGDVN